MRLKCWGNMCLKPKLPVELLAQPPVEDGEQPLDDKLEEGPYLHLWSHYPIRLLSAQQHVIRSTLMWAMTKSITCHLADKG